MNRLPFLLHLVKTEESSVLLNNFWEHKSQNVPFWGNVSIWKEDWPDFAPSLRKILLTSAHLHHQSHRHCTLAHQRHLPNKKGLLSISNEVLQHLWCNQGLQKIHLYCNQALFALACPVGLHRDISQHHPIFFNAAFNCFCLGPLSLSSKRSLWAISAVKDVIWTFRLIWVLVLNFAFEMVALSSERLKIILLHFLWLPLTLFHSSNFVYTSPVPLCLLDGQAGVDSLEAPSLLNSQRYSEQHLETLSLSSKSWKLK